MGNLTVKQSKPKPQPQKLLPQHIINMIPLEIENLIIDYTFDVEKGTKLNAICKEIKNNVNHTTYDNRSTLIIKNKRSEYTFYTTNASIINTNTQIYHESLVIQTQNYKKYLMVIHSFQEPRSRNTHYSECNI